MQSINWSLAIGLALGCATGQLIIGFVTREPREGFKKAVLVIPICLLLYWITFGFIL